MPHSMNANWFIFFQKEVVSTSVKWLLDFLNACKKIKIPKAKFQPTETSFWDFWLD